MRILAEHKVEVVRRHLPRPVLEEPDCGRKVVQRWVEEAPCLHVLVDGLREEADSLLKVGPVTPFQAALKVGWGRGVAPPPRPLVVSCDIVPFLPKVAH